MKKFLQEFKEFALKGNGLDLAVAVIMGAAFGKVVNAVVEIFLNPILENLTTMLLIPQNLSSNVVLEEWHHSTVRTSITDIVTGKIVSDVVYSIPKTSSIQLAKYCKGWAPDYKFTFRVAMGMDDTEIKTAVTDWLETREIIPGDE